MPSAVLAGHYEIFNALYKKNNKTVETVEVFRKRANCCKKEQRMSEDEHSESGFYYPNS